MEWKLNIILFMCVYTRIIPWWGGGVILTKIITSYVESFTCISIIAIPKSRPRIHGYHLYTTFLTKEEWKHFIIINWNMQGKMPTRKLNVAETRRSSYKNWWLLPLCLSDWFRLFCFIFSFYYTCISYSGYP